MISQTRWGSVNITQGNSAKFSAEFFDQNGMTLVPRDVSVIITYENINNASRTDVIHLVQEPGMILTGSWSSVDASPGLASWTISATSGSTATQSGIIRVIDATLRANLSNNIYFLADIDSSTLTDMDGNQLVN